jgi:CBS domain-containing protein
VEEIHLLKEELIFRKGESFHKGIYFVLSGNVRMVNGIDQLDLAVGDAVGIATFLGKTMYTVTAIADSDCDLVFIDEGSFYSLMDKTPEFRERFMRIIVERLNNLSRMTTHTHSLSAYQSIGGCMSSPLITLHNSKSVADAARLIAEHDIGALVIMNRKHVLKGLLTTRHLAQNYLANATVSPEEALAENYANPNPLLLPQEYPLVETFVEMLRHHEDYALITRKNKPVGIISKTDIIKLLANGSDVFAATVSIAADFKELKEVVQSLPKIVENMLNNTSLFREILPTLSTNHIIIQKRAFELARKEYSQKHGFELSVGRFSMISIGAEARREMTLKLIQGHALILDDKMDEAEVARYKDFAVFFAKKLEELGYAHAPNGMSLSKPEMAKKASEWQEHISVSIHKSNEDNIPFTRVLFDCEHFEGDEALTWSFKDFIYNTLKEKSLFFGRLIKTQSRGKIPVSQFGSFIVEKDGPYPGTIDLKANALDFLTYTSQAFSYNADLLDINTVRRLYHMGRKKLLDEEIIHEAVQAYESIVDLILHEQLSQANEGKEISFRVNPFDMSMHSQERLKRALHVVARYFGEALGYFK